MTKRLFLFLSLSTFFSFIACQERSECKVVYEDITEASIPKSSGNHIYLTFENILKDSLHWSSGSEHDSILLNYDIILGQSMPQIVIDKKLAGKTIELKLQEVPCEFSLDLDSNLNFYRISKENFNQFQIERRTSGVFAE